METVAGILLLGGLGLMGYALEAFWAAVAAAMAVAIAQGPVWESAADDGRRAGLESIMRG
jgi:hypothetical protein